MFKIIAISGVGRAGKDSFCRFASDYLDEKGISHKKWAFADELKKDMADFIQEKCGVSVFTDDSKIKNAIRPLMVFYGKYQREKSRGQHWINKIKDELLSSEGPQVRFITDLRFASFGEGDELDFVKSNGGKVIHVSRYEEEGWSVISPMNEEEEKNDPIIRKAADVRFRWHTFVGTGMEDIARKEVYRIMDENPGLWKTE